jgi:hypothetical protein
MIHAEPDGSFRIFRARRSVHRLKKEMPERQPLAALRIFISSPLRCTSLAPALGLTQIQSSSGGASIVPFVSTAISNPRAWRASMSGPSNCSSGSPPVHTTNFLPWPSCSGQADAIASASGAALEKLPPPGPFTPTKSVSQNWQTAVARSFSRPDHRLHPANRQNTAARPACAPSPCSV